MAQPTARAFGDTYVFIVRSDGGAECKRIHDATGGHAENSKEEDIKQEAQSSGQAMNIVNESS